MISDDALLIDALQIAPRASCAAPSEDLGWNRCRVVYMIAAGSHVPPSASLDAVQVR
jgi:hypothetical protein